MRDTLVLRGQSSNIGFAFIQDTTSTTGAGLTGVTSGSGSLAISVRREKSSAVTTYSGANIGAISTLGTWANPGTGKVNIKAVDGTNMPGLYELHFEDAIFNTSDTSRKLIGYISGVTNMAPTPFEIPLAAVDPQDAVKFGMTRVVANADQIAGSSTIDGISLSSFFTAQLAKIVGKISVTDNGNGTVTLSFKKQDGTTESFQLTFASVNGARVTTGTVT